MAASASSVMRKAILDRAAKVRCDRAYLGFLEWVGLGPSAWLACRHDVRDDRRGGAGMVCAGSRPGGRVSAMEDD